MTMHHRPMSVELSANSQLADLELAHDEAIALFHQGDLDQAFEDLHGISLHANVSPHLRIRCLLAMGQILDVNGREQDAIALFQQVWYDGAATEAEKAVAEERLTRARIGSEREAGYGWVSHGARTPAELVAAARDALSGGDVNEALGQAFLAYEHPDATDAEQAMASAIMARGHHQAGNLEYAESWAIEALGRPIDDTQRALVERLLEQVREARAPVTAATVSPTSTPDELRTMFGLSAQLIMSRLYDQALEILYAMYQHPNVEDSWKPKIALNIASALRDSGHPDVARSWYLEATMRGDERDDEIDAMLQKINVTLTLD
jgi:tetratricopeptide (TPR) repeat protein